MSHESSSNFHTKISPKVTRAAFRIIGAVGLILIVGIFITFLWDGYGERSEYANQRILYEQEIPLWERMDALREKSDTDPASNQALIEMMPPEEEFRSMVSRRAQFEADEIAIENLMARQPPPTILTRILEVIDAPFRNLSFGVFTLDKRNYLVIEAERRQYPKSVTQDLLGGALTLGVIGALVWLAVNMRRKYF